MVCRPVQLTPAWPWHCSVVIRWRPGTHTPASHQHHTIHRIHRIQVTQLVIAQPAVTVVTARTAPAGAGRARQGRRRGAESFLIRSNIWLLVTFVHYM